MKRAHAGFAIVTAIILLVGLAVLGVFMVTLSGTHQAAQVQSLIATRVYFAAKAGLEWGIRQAIATNSCVASSPVTVSGTGLTGATGVTVTVTCTSTAHTGGNIYLITSTAVRGTFGAYDYAQRRMEATVTNIP